MFQHLLQDTNIMVWHLTLNYCNININHEVKRECKYYFTCYSVNEFRTSQICPTCNSRLFNVRKHLRNGSRRRTVMVRGLKYCNSEICCSHRYMNRDVVGCANIYRKTRTIYPDVMDRSSTGWSDPAKIHEFRSKYWWLWVCGGVFNAVNTYRYFLLHYYYYNLLSKFIVIIPSFRKHLTQRRLMRREFV